METIYPCLFEFFFSNDYRKGGAPWNVVDLFLAKRSAYLDTAEKHYLRALRRSYMSLYEVLEVLPEQGLLLRDLIGDGESVHVEEKSLTKSLSPWDVVGLRVVRETKRTVLGGGGLLFDRETGKKLAKEIAALHRAAQETLIGIDYSEEDKERLLKVMWAKEIGTGYLEQCLKRRQKSKPRVINRDGDPIQFHTLTFQLNTPWGKITEKLDSVRDYHRDDDTPQRKFWNYIDLPGKKTKSRRIKDEKNTVTFETTLTTDDLDQPIHVLGTIELTRKELVAQANSLNRAKTLEKRLQDLLETDIGAAVWKIEEMDARDDHDKKDVKRSTAPHLTPEEITLQIHAMITQHYRAWLTMKNQMLGGKTPKQLSHTKDGQAQVIEALKGVENSVRRLEHDSGVLRPLDLSWMWEELGLDRATA